MRKILLSIFLVGSFVHSSKAAKLSELKAFRNEKAESTQKNRKFVLFWASWCTTCKEKLSKTLPALDQSKDVSVITVNTDKEIRRAENFIEKNQVSLPVYLDESKSLRSELKVFSVPHWAVFQRENEKAEWKLVASEAAFETESINKALGGKYL